MAEGLQVYSSNNVLLTSVDSRMSRIITRLTKAAPANTDVFTVSHSAFAGMDIYVFCPTVNQMINGDTFPAFAYFEWVRTSSTSIQITYGFRGGWGSNSAPMLPFEFTIGVY